MKDNATVEWLKVIVPAAIAIGGFAIGLWQYREGRWRRLLIDVQEGDKSTVAFVAMQVWNGEFPKRTFPWKWKWPKWVDRRRSKRRQELFQALCLAAVFQKSGRSMSLVHGALASVAQDPHFRREVKQIVDLTTVAITRSWSYTDLQSGRRRLNSLRAALQLDGGLRLRLDAYEFFASSEARHLPSDPRLSWAGLERAIRQQGSLVVVLPPAGQYPVVSLSFHDAGADVDVPSPLRATEPADPLASGANVASMEPRSVSAHLLRAKYPKAGQPAHDSTAWLARRLAAVIEEISAYRDADAIAVVPGRQHRFSDELGKAVASVTRLKEVGLTPDWSKDASFTVPEDHRSLVAGKTVVVLDDVYRSGQTFQTACTSVREAGAKTVLGITAVCTVSPAGDAAANDCGRLS